MDKGITEGQVNREVLARKQKDLDLSWSEWLKENLNRKCSPEELLATLLSNDFSVDAIRSGMGLLFPSQSPLLKHQPPAPDKPGSVDYKALANVFDFSVRKGLARKIPAAGLQLFEIDDFLTDLDCQRIIEISSSRLRHSTVTTGEQDRGYRTSFTCDLSLLDDPFVVSLDRKISSTLGVCNAYSEGIQAQRYEVGQQFKNHVDYFIPGTPAYDQHARGNYGQRTWTFMVYLNDVKAGGETHFPIPNLTISPRRGKALLWNNLCEDGVPNPRTEHSGLPVQEGFKVVITKWFRELGMGPMFCDRDQQQ